MNSKSEETNRSPASILRPPAPTRAPGPSLNDYATWSMRPLHILAFIFPLVVLYEVGSVYFLTDSHRGTVEAIVAHSVIVGFFQQFGAVGRYLPALALCTFFVLWHILRRDRWTLRPGVLLGMLMESIVWAVPLLVLLMVVQKIGSGPLARAFTLAGTGGDLAERSWPIRLTISVGAGVYEEFLFRLVGMAALHFVLVDLIRLRDAMGQGLAVVLSAIAFALYHDLTPNGRFEVVRALVYLAAGLYFGALYLWRGYGIVAAVHALYDIVVLIGLQPRT